MVGLKNDTCHQITSLHNTFSYFGLKFYLSPYHGKELEVWGSEWIESRECELLKESESVCARERERERKKEREREGERGKSLVWLMCKELAGRRRKTPLRNFWPKKSFSQQIFFLQTNKQTSGHTFFRRKALFNCDLFLSLIILRCSLFGEFLVN